MAELPSGTVTFLFTDIEGSTTRWEHQPEAMRAALARHDAIVRAAIREHGGHVIKTMGDAFHAAFSRAPDAVSAALAAQRRLHAEAWGDIGPLRVRMALHTGAAEERDGDYYGPQLNRVARLLATGHGGQVLLSLATCELVRDAVPEGATLLDLGEHRLKDLIRPEHVFQITSPGLPSDFPPLRSLDARPHNLPVHPSALLGREQDIARARVRLLREDVRLLTLTGPGGTGKTRLALQIAADMIDQVADGVYFVALAPISDPDLVASTIAQTLGVRVTADRPIVESLKGYLSSKQILLLLDNFEQILPAAPLVSELLGAAPRLKMLVTSRAALQVRGEHEEAVTPLTLPDRRQAIKAATLSQYSAVALFIERATAIRGDFAVTNENAPAVAEICHRLDGLPLAIELAAAKTRLLTPQAVLTRFERRLPLLTGGARDLPARQQTLRNTIAWSHDLLTAEEQTLYRRLAIFVGGCTVEAAEAVCDPDGTLGIDVLDGVTSLAAQSLVRQAEGPDAAPRFGMLETIREFGQERLDASGEATEIGRRHAEYFLGLAERAEPYLHGPDQIACLDRLAVEHDNFQAALSWTLGAGNDLLTGARLVAALGWFWVCRGLLSETRWLEAALVATDELTADVAVIRARAKALCHLGWIGRSWNDPPRTVALAEASVALSRSIGDRPGLAYTLTVLAILLRDLRDYPRAKAAAEEGIAIGREVGEARATAHGLYVLASILWYESYVPVPAGPTGEQVETHREPGRASASPRQPRPLFDFPPTPGNRRAIELLEESVAICRRIGDLWGLGIALVGGGGLTINTLIAGDYARATEACRESIRLYWRMRDLGQVSVALRNFGHVALCTQRPRRAARLLAAFRRVYEAVWGGLALRTWPATEHEAAVLRSWLSDTELEAADAEGRAMSVEPAVAYALEEPGSS